MKAWLIVGLLAVGLLQSLPKQADKPNANQDTGKQTPNQTPEPITKNNPPIVGPGPSSQLAQNSANAEAKQASWFEKFLTPIVSNWPLIAVAIGGILVARSTLKTIARQALSMRRQTTHLRNSVIQGRKAADAALLNAQAVINSERAWVEIELGASEKDPLDNNDDGFLKYSIQITNGRTVARIESFQIGADCVVGELRLEDLSCVTKNFNTLLGDGEKTTVTNIDLGNEFSDWPSIGDATKTGLIQIAVRYRDVVEGSVLHETSAVYIYNTNSEEPERLSRFNKYT